MNPVFGKAMGMLKSRAAGGMAPMHREMGTGPMVQAKAPESSGGGLLDKLRSRVRGSAAGPTPMKRPPSAY